MSDQDVSGWRRYAEPRVALMLALGFSSGLPLLLVFGTLSAWLAEAKVPIKEIGFLSYLGLAYTLKFAWAPIIDSYDVPGLARLVGRRRAWMIAAQAVVAAGLIGVGFGDPATSLPLTAACAFIVAFGSATQDVVIDGWRIDAAPTSRQGVMAAAYQLGYRLALICAGAGALYIADAAGWRAAYFAMAALMGVGVVASLLSPIVDRGEALAQPGATAEGPRSGWSLQGAVVEPLADLFRRYGRSLIAILILVALYRLPDFVSGVMANPLYITLGFTKSQIASVSKLYGVWVSIAGAFAGGLAVPRLGLYRALILGAVVAPTSHLMLAWLAAEGPRIELLILAISVENFCTGFAGTVLIAFMSGLTSAGHAATQYALLSSLYALPGKLVGGLSGVIVESFGFSAFFTMTAAIGLPVVVLAATVGRAAVPAEAEPEAGAAAEAAAPPIAPAAARSG